MKKQIEQQLSFHGHCLVHCITGCCYEPCLGDFTMITKTGHLGKLVIEQISLNLEEIKESWSKISYVKGQFMTK